MALHRLLATARPRRGAADGEEARDVDTWADLRDLREPTRTADPAASRGCGRGSLVNVGP